MLKVLIFVAIIASVLGNHSVMAFGETLVSLGSTIINALSRVYECFSGGSQDDDNIPLTRITSSSSSIKSVAPSSSSSHGRPVSIAASAREFNYITNSPQSSTTDLPRLERVSSTPSSIAPSAYFSKYSTSNPSTTSLIPHPEKQKRSRSLWSNFISTTPATIPSNSNTGLQRVSSASSSIRTSSNDSPKSAQSSASASTKSLYSHPDNQKRWQSLWSKLMPRTRNQHPSYVPIDSLRAFQSPDPSTNLKRASSLPTQRPSFSKLHELDATNFTIVDFIRHEVHGEVFLATEHGEVYTLKAVNILDVHQNIASQSITQTLNYLFQIRDDAIHISGSDFVLGMQFICVKGNWIFFISEFGIKGNVVEHVLRRHEDMESGCISYEEARLLLSEVFYGVHVLHTEYNIMHGNLKWEHIFLDEYGHVKIGVFDRATQRSTYIIPEDRNMYKLNQPCSLFLDTCQLAMMVTQLKIFDADSHIWALQQQLETNLIKLSHADPTKADLLSMVKKSKFFAGIDWDRMGSTSRNHQPIQSSPVYVKVDRSYTIDRIISKSNNPISQVDSEQLQNRLYYVNPKHQNRYYSRPPTGAFTLG